jgi:hypothetical protein
MQAKKSSLGQISQKSYKNEKIKVYILRLHEFLITILLWIINHFSNWHMNAIHSFFIVAEKKISL